MANVDFLQLTPLSVSDLSNSDHDTEAFSKNDDGQLSHDQGVIIGTSRVKLRAMIVASRVEVRAMIVTSRVEVRAMIVTSLAWW